MFDNALLAVVAPWAISMVCMEFVSRPMKEQIHDHRQMQPKEKTLLHYEKQVVGFRMRSTLPRRVGV